MPKPLVVLIDDDSSIRTAISDALEEYVDVIAAADGNEGLALAEMKYPDLIVLDLMMPKRSGFLVLEYLRRETEIVCPVIVITGNEGVRHKEYAELLGADRYLCKPFRIRTIVDCVLDLLGSKVSDLSNAVN